MVSNLFKRACLLCGCRQIVQAYGNLGFVDFQDCLFGVHVGVPSLQITVMIAL